MADKEAIVFIVDVGKSMGQVRNGRTVSDLDWSLKYVFDKITSIIALGRKTLSVGVLGLGTDDTRNDMAEDDGYQQISVLQSIQPMTMVELRTLTPLLKSSSTNDRDAMSAIILAIDMIMRYCRHLQFKKKICLVTNATGAMDPDDIESTANQIEKNNIELTVLGVDFDDPDFGYKEEDKSHVKGQNEKLLKMLVDGCDGTFGTMQEAIDGLAIPHVKPVRPTPTYKGQLRLGDPSSFDTAITIDVERYFKVSVRRPPTASSFVLNQSYTEDENLAAVNSSRSYYVQDAAAPGNKLDIKREDLAKGYQYGRTAVPISESDENITKLETISGYDILGFIPKENVERYMVYDNTNMIVAQKGNPKAELALSSLIHALFEIDSCAIARLVKKDMTEPFLTLLTPFANNEIECLIENVLPYTEDVRQYRFPPIDKVLTISGKQLQSHRNLPSKDLMAAMSDFVDDMTILDEDELRLENTYSPVFHSIEGAIKHRAVHSDTTLFKVPDFFMTPSQPPPDLIKQSEFSLRHLVTVSDVKKVPPRVKGRRKFRDPQKPLSGLNVADLFPQKSRIKISNENLIPEFRQLTETTGDINDVYDAVGQVQTIVETQIRDSFGDNNYSRVLEELGMLRHELSELDENRTWNVTIKSIKQKILSEELGGNRKEMWWKIRNARLGLLESTGEDGNESHEPKVTVEDVEAFWKST